MQLFADRIAEIRGYLGRPERDARNRALVVAAELVHGLRARGLPQRLPAMGEPSPEAVSAAWLVYGQACEAMGDRSHLEEALRAYAGAITACGGPPGPAREPAVRRALALAWMNRGNALLARGGAADLDAAAWAYEQAIAAFEALLAPGHEAAAAETRNSLGAAWLNRGRALQGQATPADLRASIASYERAIAVLKELRSAQNPWHRINLAAAHLNLANAALALASVAGTSDARGASLASALAAARAACAGIASFEAEHGAAAEVGLKGRRVLACVLGERLASPDTTAPAAERRAWADEAAESIEGGLACVRTWEVRGVRGFRPLAARLFRLGVQLYRGYQPQFLAEFVLEALDPAKAQPGPQPLAGHAELLAAARAAIAEARVDLRTRRRIDFGSESTERLLAVLEDLDAAEGRLRELCSCA